ncbi:MAG: DEAD/DEAH box helicase [Candidatus Eisenbacteria bacterium]
MSGFASMGLCPEILQALEEAGYENPTPIQEMAIPPALLGKDIMGCAQTGTGKTAAFTLPMLHRLRNEEPGSLRALILVPTRELAIQVGRNIRTYAQHMKLRTTAVYGGVPMDPQEMMLRYGVDILVATPGRLKDHMWRGNIDYRHTCYLVLDEADRMLDMGFIDAVREIVREIPSDRQTMLFSATLDPEIRRLARDILKEPERIEVAPPTSTAEGVEQILINVGHDSKRDVIHQVLALPDMDRTLVFTRTKRGASSLSSYLKSHGHRCTSIHSDKTQERRLEALNAFRDGQVDVLVATDIAARGLDVTGISHVVNFDLPHSPEDYVHRIGRTARAGRKGMAISLMGSEETRNLAAIERHLGRRLALAHLDDTGELIMSRVAAAENGSGAGAAGARPARRPTAARAAVVRGAPAEDVAGGVTGEPVRARHRRTRSTRSSRSPWPRWRKRRPARSRPETGTPSDVARGGGAADVGVVKARARRAGRPGGHRDLEPIPRDRKGGGCTDGSAEVQWACEPGAGAVGTQQPLGSRAARRSRTARRFAEELRVEQQDEQAAGRAHAAQGHGEEERRPQGRAVPRPDREGAHRAAAEAATRAGGEHLHPHHHQARAQGRVVGENGRSRAGRSFTQAFAPDRSGAGERPQSFHARARSPARGLPSNHPA